MNQTVAQFSNISSTIVKMKFFNRFLVTVTVLALMQSRRVAAFAFAPTKKAATFAIRNQLVAAAALS